MQRRFLFAIAVLATLAILLSASLAPDRRVREVTVYTSVDQVYSEPIFKAFEKAAGIRVNALYDAEDAKSVGLANRLIAERNRPLADVFWNGEVMQTLALKDEGALTPYVSPASATLPARLKDTDGYWAAFGGRARVLIVNTHLLDRNKWPKSIFELTARAKEVAVSNPLFGFTGTHAAALGATIGVEQAVKHFAELKANGALFVDGNAVVRDLVAAGRRPMGMTDTDDACVAIKRADPVAVVFLDQGEGGLGDLVVPNSVGLIKNAPHPDEGKALIDYLLAPQTEAVLVASGWLQLASRSSEASAPCYGRLAVRPMDAPIPAIRAAGAQTAPRLRAIFQD